MADAQVEEISAAGGSRAAPDAMATLGQLSARSRQGWIDDPAGAGAATTPSAVKASPTNSDGRDRLLGRSSQHHTDSKRGPDGSGPTPRSGAADTPAAVADVVEPIQPDDAAPSVTVPMTPRRSAAHNQVLPLQVSGNYAELVQLSSSGRPIGSAVDLGDPAAFWVVGYVKPSATTPMESQRLEFGEVATATKAASKRQVLEYWIVFGLCCALVLGIWGISYGVSEVQTANMGRCSVNRAFGCACNAAFTALSSFRNIIFHDGAIAIAFIVILNYLYGLRWGLSFAYFFAYCGQYVACYGILYAVLGLDAAVTYGVQLLLHCLIMVVAGILWHPQRSWQLIGPMLWFLIVISVLPGVLGLLLPMLYRAGMRNIFQTIYPFIIAAMEYGMAYRMRTLASIESWDLQDLAILSRFIVATFDTHRLGSIAASVQSPDTTSPVSGPFINALLISFVMECGTRNGLHMLAFRRIVKRQSWDEIRMHVFRRMMCGNRYDMKLVPLLVLVWFKVYNWSYSSFIVGCDGSLLVGYQVPAQYLAVLFLAEAITATVSYLIMIGMRRFVGAPYAHITPVLLMPDTKLKMVLFFVPRSMSVLLADNAV